MLNKITGAIAVIMIAMFFGEYATTLNSVPLWIIILSVLAMVVADYIFSLRSGNGE